MTRWLVLVALLGCGKRAADCKLEAEELYTLLKTTPHQGSPFYGQNDVALAKRSDLANTDIPGAPIVTMTAGTIKLGGKPFGDATSLAETAKSDHDKYSPMRERANMRIYLQIDKATPLRSVVEVARALEGAGFTPIGFAFSTGAKLTPPPRSPIDDKLDAVMAADKQGGNQATDLARMMSDVIKGCGGLEKAFGAVGSEEGGNKADILIEGTKEGLIECNCKVDVPALRSILWRVMATDPDIQVIAYSSVLKGDKLAFPGTATWGEVGPKLPRTASVELIAN